MLLDLNDRRLSSAQRRKLRNVIASSAMEGYFPTAVEVDRFIRQVLGIITEEQAFAEIEAEELGEEVASAIS